MHPSQRVPVLIPVPPRLHHVGVHVEVARGLNLGVHRLSHRPLPGLDAALFLLREYLRGPHLLLSPSPRFFLPTGLRLFGLRLQAGDALHGGVPGPVLVPEEQLLDLRGVIALNLDAIVTGDGASRAHRSLHHRQKLGLIASDVSDDCRHLALRPLLDGDGHPALLCAAHLERHDDTRPPEPSSPPPPGAPRSASPDNKLIPFKRTPDLVPTNADDVCSFMVATMRCRHPKANCYWLSLSPTPPRRRTSRSTSTPGGDPASAAQLCPAGESRARPAGTSRDAPRAPSANRRAWWSTRRRRRIS